MVTPELTQGNLCLGWLFGQTILPGIIRLARSWGCYDPMPNLPTGTVTLLFTDIEGSTRLWEAHAAAMRAALARHDALLRHCIGDHDGNVFKTGGDAFCAAFHTAPDAVAAALDAQRALAREPWPEA